MSDFTADKRFTPPRPKKYREWINLEFSADIFNNLKARIPDHGIYIKIQFPRAIEVSSGRLCKNQDPLRNKAFPWCIIVPGPSLWSLTSNPWVKIIISDNGYSLLQTRSKERCSRGIPGKDIFLEGDAFIKLDKDYFAAFSDVKPYKKIRQQWKPKKKKN